MLIVTNHEDVTTDYIVLELERRGIDFYRLNSECLPQALLRITPDAEGGQFEIQFPNETIPLMSIGSAYFRRPGLPIALDEIECPSDRQYCESEWSGVLKFLYSVLDQRWLNSPAAIDAAENKPLQLCIASGLGFRVPETRITNDVASVQQLLQAGPIVAKPLRTALVNFNDEERVIFTNSVTRADELEGQAVRAAPIIFQRQIEKELDIRVTVVGTKVFSVAIHSQVGDETRIDWRKGSNVALDHTVLTLPPPLEELCIALLKRLGLRFGAIDLVKDVNGQYWFLEINPNGQWAWIENRTGLPIASAIVDELEAITKR